MLGQQTDFSPRGASPSGLMDGLNVTPSNKLPSSNHLMLELTPKSRQPNLVNNFLALFQTNSTQVGSPPIVIFPPYPFPKKKFWSAGNGPLRMRFFSKTGSWLRQLSEDAGVEYHILHEQSRCVGGFQQAKVMW